MTYDGLLKQLREKRPQAVFDPDYDGACPCFDGWLYVDDVIVHAAGHCWRVSESIEDGYQDCELNSYLPREQTMELARVLKEELDSQEWYNPYRIKVRYCECVPEEVLE